MQNVKVSIIIPVHNSAEYLERCVDSVVNQTHQNLEIILVDDGSTDSSGKICDRYANRYARLKAIHQENAGVAEARNAGLDAATGDYIGWVDSDDWVEPQMFEIMSGRAEAYGADIVICSRQEQYADQCLLKGWKRQEILDREQALTMLVEDDLVKSYLWDKLWRRELFNGVRIPGLKVFEDMAVMCRLFMKTKRVVCLPDVLYHYEHREASLSATPSLTGRVDFYEVSKRRFEELKDDFPQLADRLEAALVSAAVHIWAAYYGEPRHERNKYKLQIKDVADFCKEHYRTALKKDKLGLAGQFVLRLTPYPRRWAFAMAWLVAGLYQWKHGRPL